MKISDYLVLGDNDESALAAKVLARIKDGWQPFGSLQVVCPQIDEVPAPAFYQAMVRYEPAD